MPVGMIFEREHLGFKSCWAPLVVAIAIPKIYLGSSVHYVVDRISHTHIPLHYNNRDFFYILKEVMPPSLLHVAESAPESADGLSGENGQKFCNKNRPAERPATTSHTPNF